MPLFTRAVADTALAADAVSASPVTPSVKIARIKSAFDSVPAFFDTTAVTWTPAIVSGQGVIPCTSAYDGFITNIGYDLSESAVYLQVVSQPGEVGTRGFFLDLSYRTNTDMIRMYDQGGAFTATILSGGVASNTSLGTYSPTTHAWWRIRHSGSTVYWDASPDGATWTNLTSKPQPTFPIVTMKLLISCGYYGTETSPPNAVVDNLNYPAGGFPLPPSRNYFQAAQWHWNTIRANPVLHPKSAVWAGLLSTGTNHAVATYQFGVTVLDASLISSSTPRYTIPFSDVPLFGPDPFGGRTMPIPHGTIAPPGAPPIRDGPLSVADPTTGFVYSIGPATYNYSADSWSAEFGSLSTLTGDGLDIPGGASTGSRLNRYACVVRKSEIQAGVIPHALLIASDMVKSGEVHYPALATDGTNIAGVSDPIPMGLRVQIDPSINLAAISGITPFEVIIGKALQDYGAYIGDSSGARVIIPCEFDPTDPAPEYAAAGCTGDYFRLNSIPWSSLRVLSQWDGLGAGPVLGNANPTWPLVCNELDCTVGPPGTPGPNRVSLNAGYRGLQTSTIDTDRGRVWELDHAQTGTLTASIKDPREILNPDNSASPLNIGGSTITSYRAGQVYAVWPTQPGSGNLLNPNVSPVYDPSFASGTGGWTKVGGTTSLTTSATQSFDGLTSLLVAQSGTFAAFGIFLRPGLAPGIQYTFSCYVYATGGCSVSARVTNAKGAISASATVAVQNTWTRVSVTWTAVDTAEQITIYGSVVSTPNYYVDATQLEFGPSPTAFTISGPTAYPLITHYVERYPTTYDMGGTRAVRPLQGVDALGILNNAVISQSYDLTIAADNPTYYFPLNNTATPPNGAALSGQRGDSTSTFPRYIGNTTNGVPTFLYNGSINWAGDTCPDGTAAVEFAANVAGNSTTMDVIGGSFSADATNGVTMEVWAKVTYGAGAFGGLYVLPPSTGNISYYTISDYGHLVMAVNGGTLNWGYDPTGSALQTVSTGMFPGAPAGQTAQWHYYASTLVGGVWKHTIDGVETSQSVTSPGNIGFTYLCHCEAFCFGGAVQAQVAVARWAVYPTDIGFSRRQAHYNRGIGYLGEISGARIARLLNTYWGGPISVAPGVMAMAEDFAYSTSATASSGAQTVLSVIQSIEASERGLAYANRNGVIVFEDRSSRYSGTQTALWTFGENAGEYPYSDYTTDFDPTYVFTQANLTRPGNQNFAPLPNPLPMNPTYGQRIVQQEIQCTNDYDLTQAANSYLSRYSKSRTRISKLVLDPAGNPSLFPVVLSLEISQRVTVKRRVGGVAVSGDYYIEKISHSIDFANGKWLVTLQLSPVFVPSAWVMGDSTFGVLGTKTVPVY